MKTVLALESSTSAAKAAIYDEQGNLLRLEQMAWPWSGVDLQDASLLVSTLLACGKKAAQGFAVEAIGLSGIMPSLLLCAADGMPLSPIWTWAHTGSAQTVEKYTRDGALADALYRRTGCPAHTQYPLWQLIHRREERDPAFFNAEVITTQLGYVFFRLTGKFVSSRATESSSGMFCLEKRDWDDEALALAHILREQLSPLAECDEHWPLEEEAAQALGVRAGIPVSVGAPDGILNQIGSGAMKQGAMTFSVGTSGALRIACPVPGTSGGRDTWCYYIRDAYLAGASTSGAGSCVSWFRRSFAPGVAFETLESEAEAVAEEEIPCYLPFNFGERAPGFCAARQGAFCGLTGEQSRGHLYRAVLEGVMFNLYHCYELLIQKTGKPEKILLSGGVTHSPLWMRLAADTFGREMLLHEGEHASLNGAAALALKACGCLASLEDYQPQIIGAIRPEGAMRPALMERYARYLAYYRRTDPTEEPKR
ncbi:MAG: FGGY family carbohydrate kinase [Eubacteriales bacterium]|nr:FGGY family carbohydrate kinase [Eubacteriales bacterium]